MRSPNLIHPPPQGLSPLLTLLIDPDHGTKSETYTALPAKSFAFFQAFLRFINGSKWFLMSVCHPPYSYYTIAFQGLYFLEDQTTARNLAARWQDTTIQTAPISYQVLEIVHNLFATLSDTA